MSIDGLFFLLVYGVSGLRGLDGLGFRALVHEHSLRVIEYVVWKN